MKREAHESSWESKSWDRISVSTDLSSGHLPIYILHSVSATVSFLDAGIRKIAFGGTKVKRVLIADDDEHIRRLIRTALKSRPDEPEMHVFEAGNGGAALALAKEVRPDLIVLDHQMPVLTGLECCREIRKLPDLQTVPVILLTASILPEMRELADAAGVTEYIAKPFSPRALRANIDRLLLGDAPSSASRELLGPPTASLEPQLFVYAEDLQASLEEVRAAHQELRVAYLATVQALASALEARDIETAGHCERVASLTITLARAYGLPESEFDFLRFGAVLHDVGKIGVPDAILRKPGPLDDAEWAVIRRHPVQAETMLAGISFLRRSLPIVRHHHERWDGRGYPHGLAGAAIPIGARIFVVADSLDAMTSNRPYRPALHWDEAVAEILHGRGTQFDPEVVDAFQRCEAMLQQATGQSARSCAYDRERRAGPSREGDSTLRPAG